MMRLVVFREGKQVAEVDSEREPLEVGSDERCAVRVPLTTAFPIVIAKLIPEGMHRWVLEPVSNEVVVYVNGGVISIKTPLENGDQIKVADLLMRFHLDETPAAAADTTEQPTAPATASAARASVESLTGFVKYQLPPGSSIRKPDEPLRIPAVFIRDVGRLNLALNVCESVEQLMSVTLNSLLRMFRCHIAWIGIRRLNYGAMDYVEGRAADGRAAEMSTPGEKLRPRVLDRSQTVLIPQVDPQDRRAVLAGPLIGPSSTLGMVYLDGGTDRDAFVLDDLDQFAYALSVIALQLDAILEQLAKARAATLEGQVSVAHAIQARLTPRKLPQWPELQFGAFRELGRERTSDVYDVVRLGNQTAGFIIAHTNARGPHPGLVMAQVQAAFRTACMHVHSPSTALKSLNYLLYDGTGELETDVLMGVLDPSTGKLTFSVAGGLKAYIISARGEERMITPDAPPPPLAQVKSVDYGMLETTLEPEETLVLYTPGVITAKNSAGEIFGEERFIDLLADGFGQQASAMLKEMLHDLQAFTQSGTQPEDITVILAHRMATI